MDDNMIENAGKEMVVYQPDNLQAIEVRVAEETVWLTQAQMADLFDTSPQNITLHIGNVYKEGELDKVATCKFFLQVRQEGKRVIKRNQLFYNLDLILSVGYRVKSIRATQFRIWATSILKNFLLTGAITQHRIERIESKILEHDCQLQTLLQTALPPKQGIFFQGQIFDAYQFVADLIRSAKKSILLIDNYVDDSVLKILLKRNENVSAIILVNQISPGLKLDLQRHNAQYQPIEIKEVFGIHDRFILLDDAQLYTFGASFKDLGKKLFCFSKIECSEVVEAVEKLMIG